MIDQKLAVSFLNFTCDIPHDPIDVTFALEIQERLRQRGYQCIVITGLPRDEFLAPIQDDVYQLCVAYAQLERILKSGNFGTHTCFLGDGALTIIASACPDKVSVKLESAPQTRAALAYSSSVDTTLDCYVFSWRQVMRSLVNAAT